MALRLPSTASTITYLPLVPDNSYPLSLSDRDKTVTGNLFRVYFIFRFFPVLSFSRLYFFVSQIHVGDLDTAAKRVFGM